MPRPWPCCSGPSPTDPKNAHAHETLGIVALRLRNPQEARDHLRRALEMNDALPIAWNTLGVALYQLEGPVAAVDAWQRAVQLDPKQYDALYNLGLVAAQQGSEGRGAQGPAPVRGDRPAAALRRGHPEGAGHPAGDRGMRNVLAVLAVLAVLLRLPGWQWRRRARPLQERPDHPDLVDTLRSDRLPAYGYTKVETPALDAFRQDSVLFERAYSHVPLTLPSHATILSGLLPGEHGVRDNSGYIFDAKRFPYLPKLLKQAGYKTGAAVSTFVLRAETGLAEGFDFYEADIDVRATESLGNSQRSGRETSRAALEWVKTVASEPFFLFLHIYEPHTPYAPESAFASYPDPYDGEVATADAIRRRVSGRAPGAGRLRQGDRPPPLRPRRGAARPRRAGARHLPLPRGAPGAADAQAPRRRAARHHGQVARRSSSTSSPRS